MRRVVVTGLGLVTPLGVGVPLVWERLIAGRSGIRAIEGFDVSDIASKIAGQVPSGPMAEGSFDPDEWVGARERRRMDRFIQYAMAAGIQAIEDAGWKPTDEESLDRTGVMIGSGIGGLQEIYNGSVILHERGARKLSPFFIPASLITLASGHLSIKYGFRGPNHAVVTACSTGAHALGDAALFIQCDDADVMVAGGAEAAVCRIGMAGFAAARALSTQYNDTPERASRPWDKGRDGFVMGEGAGVVVLEEYEHAKKRGAIIYGEIVGYGLSGDAYHITAPSSDGGGAFRAMRNALKRAGVGPESIDYVIDKIRDRPSAGRGGQRRGDLRDPGHARQRGAPDAQSRRPRRDLPRHRPGPARGARATHFLCADQFLRFRWDERFTGLHLRGLGRYGAPCRPSPRIHRPLGGYLRRRALLDLRELHPSRPFGGADNPGARGRCGP
jgi:3-oxoacyl-[acyl-carrier-protein] synthase II